jgi:ectoine hydroxylase-related dioxygenase (phytanoyl-CoA dioxygenase family)
MTLVCQQQDTKMNTLEQKRRMEIDGFCIVENVIPIEVVDQVRESLISIQQAQSAETEAALKKTRSRGHRVGVEGVGSVRQVVNHTQTFTPYLADKRLMDVAESIFGKHVRISCTDCVVNYPGCGRGYWHADWPYNQTNATHIPSPYADVTMHLSTIWMLTDFTVESGGTLVIPGSHKSPVNPSAGDLPDIDRDASYPTEMHITGKAGSVFVADSRLWHAVAPNISQYPRVGMIIRYAPWWLNLNPTMIGTEEHTMMVVETDGKNYEQEPIKRDVFDEMPEDVKPLYRYWVEGAR